MPIRTLAEAISRYGHDAYLLTVVEDGPHTSHVTIELRGSSIGCAVGASAARNIAREPNVSLFWPPMDRGGYALIVNGAAAVERRGGRWRRSHSRNPCCIVPARGPTTATGRARTTAAA
jgi:hypothetical protein